MRYSSLLSAALLFSLSLVHSVAADDATRAKFVKLGQANNGIVKLDSKLHDEIIAPGRDWSVVIEYTALGKEFACVPCGYVCVLSRSRAPQTNRPLPAPFILTSRLWQDRGQKCRIMLVIGTSLHRLTLGTELRSFALYVVTAIFWPPDVFQRVHTAWLCVGSSRYVPPSRSRALQGAR